MSHPVRPIADSKRTVWRIALAGGAVMLATMASAVARDLPIKSGRWTDAPSCADPSARDAGDARRFSPGSTSTGNDECRIAIGVARGKTYPLHLTCTYVQGGSGTSDILVTIVTSSEIKWRGLNPAFETTYHFCGSQ